MPDWVTDIPGVNYSPLVDDFSVDESFLAPVSTDMIAGNTRMRNLFTRDVQIESVRINVGNATALDEFLQWVRDDLERGTLKFTMPVPFIDGMVNRTCMIIGGGQGIQIVPHGPKNFVAIFKRRVEDPGVGYIDPNPPGYDTSAHLFWRVRVTVNPVNNAALTVAQVVFLDIEGNNLAVGGTAISSGDEPGNAAANAFDVDAASYWRSPIAGGPNFVGDWIGYQFSSPVNVRLMGLHPGGNGDFMPLGFAVDYADNIGGPWTEHFVVSGCVNWGLPATLRTFWHPAFWTWPNNFYEFQFSKVIGGFGGLLELVEGTMQDLDGIDWTNINGEFNEFYSTNTQAINKPPYLGFDDNLSTSYTTIFSPPGALNAWVRVRFNGGLKLDTFTWRIGGNAAAGPSTITVRESADGSTWSTIVSATGLTWTAGEIKTLVRP